MEKKKTKESYPIRTIRLSQKTWQALKDKRWKSQQGWEQFIQEIVKKGDNLLDINNK